MRIALIASTIALLAGSPAFAQCVYVACGGSVPNPPVYQQPVYQAPPAMPRPPQNTARGDYDAGYAAGLAARPRTRVVTRVVTRTVTRQSHTGTARTSSGQSHAGRGTAGRVMAASPARRHVATAAAARPAVRHTAVRAAPRPVARQVARVAPRQIARSVRTVSHPTGSSSYSDPIKNRAGTYGATTYGSATSMASLMSRSSSYSSSATTTWIGPSAVTSQNGQSCGWGARIVTNAHGQAQRQAMWVCQCPQGWRPPGY
jgi:hypothetical protein